MHLIEDLQNAGTTWRTELRAGAATFTTMAYILFVNPQILAQAGMNPGDVAVATALASAIACFVMGFWARYPFALAPGMGLNAYFAFGVVQGMGLSWQVALAAVFVEGLIFLGLSLGGLRTAVLDSLPDSIKASAMAGIGLFLTFIGMQNAGLVVVHPQTLVQLGALTSPATALSLGGLIVMAVLMRRRVPGALLFGVLGLTLVSWAVGLQALPERWLSLPHLPRETVLAFDFSHLISGGMAAAVVAFFLVDLLDTAGTLIGVGKLGGFVDELGRLERADQAFAADALGTAVGAVLGTSTVTTYAESATGVEEGGRTGLTAIFVGVFFLLALFFTPVFVAVPAMATAPALIVVGALMMRGVVEIAWQRVDEALPALLTVAVMPLTFSIANGLALGILSWVAIRVLGGRWREVKPPLAVLAALLLVFLVWVDH